MNILNQEIILELFRNNYRLFIAALFIATCSFTFYLIPKVLWVSKEKNLTASVNERSSHKVEIPSFGGVAFYMCLILVLAIIQSLRLTYVGNHLIAAVTILFMVGIKDDLVVSTARVKFFHTGEIPLWDGKTANRIVEKLIKIYSKTEVYA